jgi:hypothetical protein
MKYNVVLKGIKELHHLAETMGTVAFGHDESTYLYFPFWIKVDKDGSQELIRFEHLPTSLKADIKERREQLVTPPEALNMEVDAEEVK